MCRYRERREQNYGALLPFGCKSFYYLTVIYRAGPIEKNGRQDEGIGWPEITFTANFYDILLSSAFALPTRRVCWFYLLLLHLDLRCLSLLYFLVLTFSLVTSKASQSQMRIRIRSPNRMHVHYVVFGLSYIYERPDHRRILALRFHPLIKARSLHLYANVRDILRGRFRIRKLRAKATFKVQC